MADRMEDIERDIEQTRLHAARTVAALEQRVSPSRMMDDMLNYLRENERGRAMMRGMRDVIVDNPVPVAMIGVGIAWLAASGRRRYSDHGTMVERAYSYDEPVVPGLEEGDRFTHHVHVQDSRPGAVEGAPVAPERVIGAERAGKSAADSAQVFQSSEETSRSSEPKAAESARKSGEAVSPAQPKGAPPQART